jgi:spore germination cell wall hydrolase CwlJ-like protein
VIGLFMLALGSSEAPAQSIPAFDIKAAVRSLDVDTVAKPFGSMTSVVSQGIRATGALNATPAARSITTTLPAPTYAAGSHLPTAAAPAIAREAAWLHRAGWPLYALVDRYSAGATLDEQAQCVAIAVYFEARGETLEGQLAVANVVMNRAASGRYPSNWCSVVKQPAQFSFVRGGRFPAVDANCAAWRKAQAIARLAIADAVPGLSRDVLWYHADYVAPSWGRRLSMVQKIGTHIFYRA